MNRLFRAVLVTLASIGAGAQSLHEFEKKVTEFTLANGLHFIVVEQHDAPVVVFNTYANVGAVDDPPGKTGLAHMFEHMAFKGTPSIGSLNWPAERAALDRIERTYDQLEEEQNRGARCSKAKIQQLKAQLDQTIQDAEQYVDTNQYARLLEENGGDDLNAQTSMDSTTFYCKLPSNRLELWFLLESARFRNPVFREFYKERSVVREERRMSVESSPEGLLWEALCAAAFQVHPYHNPVVGWSSDIDHFRLAGALAFYQTYYAPSNLSIAIVGDVDPKQVRALAERYFGCIPAAPNPAPARAIEPPQAGARSVDLVSASQPLELIGYKRPDQLSPDDAVLDILSEILSRRPLGLMYKELVHDKQVALDAGAEPSFPGSKYANLFVLYLVPNQGKSLEECETPLFRILERLQTEKIDDATLQRVKRRLRADLIDRIEDRGDLAAALNTAYWAYGDWRRLFTRLDDYDKVTAADVLCAARKYFNPEGRTIARLVAARPVPSATSAGEQAAR